MVHSGTKNKAETKMVPGQKECSCCKDSCPMPKKDGSEKTGEMSCGKKECCKTKTKDDHAIVHGNGLNTDATPHGDETCCDCPCCNPKAMDKSKTNEVVTLALVSY